MTMQWHKHHIVPKHAGGTDDPSNILKCNIAMHAFMHEQRYKETGDEYDKIAADGLKGLISKAEAARQANIINGQLGGKRAVESGQLAEARQHIDKYKQAAAVAESNRKRGRTVTFNGVTYNSITSAAKANGVSRPVIRKKIALGEIK